MHGEILTAGFWPGSFAKEVLPFCQGSFESAVNLVHYPDMPTMLFYTLS